MELAKDTEAFDAESAALIDRLYQVSKGLSGGSSAKAYMNLVSETCSDPDSETAKSCLTAIGDALRLPIRIAGNFVDKASCTYVWGSVENGLFGAWEKYHDIINTKSVELPIKSNERFAFLRVSASFTRSMILSLAENEERISGGDNEEWLS